MASADFTALDLMDLHNEAPLVGNYPLQLSDAYPFRANWRKYLPLMAKHYATDFEYSNKLTSLIEEWGLADFNLPA